MNYFAAVLIQLLFKNQITRNIHYLKWLGQRNFSLRTSDFKPFYSHQKYEYKLTYFNNNPLKSSLYMPVTEPLNCGLNP